MSTTKSGFSSYAKLVSEEGICKINDLGSNFYLTVNNTVELPEGFNGWTSRTSIRFSTANNQSDL